jgi:hypothetical protein
MRSLFSAKARSCTKRPRQQALLEGPIGVTDALERLRYDDRNCRHPVGDYIRALEGRDIRARRLIDRGFDSFVFELENGDVFKITWGRLKEEHGKRSFDAPMLRRETIRLGRKASFVDRISIFVQPMAEMEADESDAALFRGRVESAGYEFHDPGPHQVGYVGGRLVLVDPFAVRRKGEGPLWTPEAFALAMAGL